MQQTKVGQGKEVQTPGTMDLEAQLELVLLKSALVPELKPSGIGFKPSRILDSANSRPRPSTTPLNPIF